MREQKSTADRPSVSVSRPGRRRHLPRKVFFMTFETAVVLAVPALLVVWAARRFELGGSVVLALLAVAFVFSWVIIVYRVWMMNKL